MENHHQQRKKNRKTENKEPAKTKIRLSLTLPEMD